MNNLPLPWLTYGISQWAPDIPSLWYRQCGPWNHWHRYLETLQDIIGIFESPRNTFTPHKEEPSFEEPVCCFFLHQLLVICVQVSKWNWQWKLSILDSSHMLTWSDWMNSLGIPSAVDHFEVIIKTINYRSRIPPQVYFTSVCLCLGWGLFKGLAVRYLPKIYHICYPCLRSKDCPISWCKKPSAMPTLLDFLTEELGSYAFENFADAKWWSK